MSKRGGIGKAETRDIGYELMGPVIHRWLLALHQYVTYFDDGETKFLYCARAGVRIKALYDLFLESRAKSDADLEMFWVSRVSICKGTFVRNREPAARLIAREYWHWPMHKLIAGLLRHQPAVLEGLDLDRDEHKAHGEVFSGWVDGPTDEAKAVRAYLEQCSRDFETYVADLLDGKKRAVLIDSGWQGSSQSLLSKAFPEYDWHGLYFGRSLLPGHDASIVSKVIGLLFERDVYDPDVPESAFVLHRHTIETLLEPNGPSIEEIPNGAHADVARTLIDRNIEEEHDPEKDGMYLRVRDYLRDNADASFAQILARHQAAMPELARIIVTPDRADVEAFYCKDRSADFGKDLDVPVLLPPDHPTHTDPDVRVQHALWPQGQIALEFDGGIARELQLRVTGLSGNSGYFDPESLEDQTADAAGELPQKPVVAIVTRTKNRPILLKRAAESVARQSWDSYLWVVVNDGGDEKAVRDIIETCPIDRRKILLVSNAKSLGMEAASNAGIRNSQSDYIVIHDDDDSWSPDFLMQTMTYLESAAGARYGGVITQSVYVSEEIRGNTVIEHERSPYQDWVRNVQLAEMVCGNFFPPIAFVYRRSVWEKVGGYNEGLPVLGDWYFNLEFLLEADIGVIRQPLAFYHHRDRGDSSRSGVYANSVIGGQSKHEEFASIMRNEFLRKNVSKNPAALTIILGYMTNEIRNQGGQLRNELSTNIHQVTSTISTKAPERDPSENSVSSAALDKVIDMADRAYLVAHFNQHASARTGGFLNRQKVEALSADADWGIILASYANNNLTLPIPPTFDEALYLATNADVDESVSAKKIGSGYEHFAKFGRNERRPRCTKNLV